MKKNLLCQNGGKYKNTKLHRKEVERLREVKKIPHVDQRSHTKDFVHSNKKMGKF